MTDAISMLDVMLNSFVISLYCQRCLNWLDMTFELGSQAGLRWIPLAQSRYGGVTVCPLATHFSDSSFIFASSFYFMCLGLLRLPSEMYHDSLGRR